MMVVCHQPYSELAKIPAPFAVRMLKKSEQFLSRLFSHTSTEKYQPNKLRPNIPSDLPCLKTR